MGHLRSASAAPVTVAGLHGVIFAALSRYVEEEHGFGLARDYDPAGAYDDGAFTAAVADAAARAGVPRDGILRGLGRHAGRVAFAEMFPDYYAASADTRDFLLGVEEKIHHVVRSTIPDAAPPRLSVVPLGAAGVVVGYTSERGLCALLEGVVAGVADYYGESLSIAQPLCMRRGDTACAVVVEPAEAAGEAQAVGSPSS